MNTKDKINQDLKQAMRDKNTALRDALRGLMAAIRQLEVDKQKELSEDEIIGVLTSEAKRRREAIEAFEEGGRDEEVAREKMELETIEGYLPKQLSREELEDIVNKAIQDVGAESPQDMGKVMGAVMPKVRGQADGRVVNEIVRQQLAAL